MSKRRENLKKYSRFAKDVLNAVSRTLTNFGACFQNLRVCSTHGISYLRHHIIFLHILFQSKEERGIMSTTEEDTQPDVDNHGVDADDVDFNDHDVDNGEFVDNFHLMSEQGNDKYSLSEQMVHFCGGAITRPHWTACKAVLVFYAGSCVSKLSTMKKVAKEAACLRIYLNAIDELEDEHFCDEAKAFFRSNFVKKHEPLLGSSLYRYYLDSRCKIRSHLLPHFPKDLVKMKSGHGFHESCNKVYIKAYRHEMLIVKYKGAFKYTKQEVSQMLPPPLWEYSKSPWYFGLTVKIFRRDPQLAPDVSDVMSDISNKPVSRAELKRQRQLDRTSVHDSGGKNKKSSNAASVIQSIVTTHSSSSSSLTHPTTPAARGMSVGGADHARMTEDNQDKMVWARVTSSRAQAQTSNVGARMNQMDELHKGMQILERMKGHISNDMFKAGIRNLYDSLPDYKSYNNQVNNFDVSNRVLPTEPAKVNKDGVDHDDSVSSDNDLDSYCDKDGRIDLAQIFPKDDGNDIEYIYTRDKNGRVTSVECRLKKLNQEKNRRAANSECDDDDDDDEE